MSKGRNRKSRKDQRRKKDLGPPDGVEKRSGDECRAPGSPARDSVVDRMLSLLPTKAEHRSGDDEETPVDRPRVYCDDAATPLPLTHIKAFAPTIPMTPVPGDAMAAGPSSGEWEPPKDESSNGLFTRPKSGTSNPPAPPQAVDADIVESEEKIMKRSDTPILTENQTHTFQINPRLSILSAIGIFVAACLLATSAYFLGGFRSANNASLVEVASLKSQVQVLTDKVERYEAERDGFEFQNNKKNVEIARLTEENKKLQAALRASFESPKPAAPVAVASADTTHSSISKQPAAVPAPAPKTASSAVVEKAEKKNTPKATTVASTDNRLPAKSSNSKHIPAVQHHVADKGTKLAKSEKMGPNSISSQLLAALAPIEERTGRKVVFETPAPCRWHAVYNKRHGLVCEWDFGQHFQLWELENKLLGSNFEIPTTSTVPAEVRIMAYHNILKEERLNGQKADGGWGDAVSKASHTRFAKLKDGPHQLNAKVHRHSRRASRLTSSGSIIRVLYAPTGVYRNPDFHPVAGRISDPSIGEAREYSVVRYEGRLLGRLRKGRQ